MITSALTFAPRNVAVFIFEVFVDGEAPGSSVGRRQHRRISAVIDHVLNNTFFIGGVIGEERDIVVSMRVRRLINPPLTRCSRQGVI